MTQHIARETVFDVEVQRTQKPGTAIIEFLGNVRIVRTDRPYVHHYISVVETTDGRITRWIGYWNPVAAADALAGAN